MEKEGISISHYDARFAKPIDAEMLHEVFSNHKRIISIEDGCLQGGFGSAILEFAADNNYQSQIVRLGIPDEIVEHGSQEELHKECGMDIQGIISTSHALLALQLDEK